MLLLGGMDGFIFLLIKANFHANLMALIRFCLRGGGPRSHWGQLFEAGGIQRRNEGEMLAKSQLMLPTELPMYLVHRECLAIGDVFAKASLGLPATRRRCN